jgi:hypothetical protein
MAGRRPVLAACDECRDARDHLRLGEQRRVPLVRHFEAFHCSAALTHGGHGLGAQNVRVGARGVSALTHPASRCRFQGLSPQPVRSGLDVYATKMGVR